MEIRNGNVSFNKFKGSGPRTDRAEVVFSGAVTQAAAILRGFDVRFSPKSDHHFGKLEVTLEAYIDPHAPSHVQAYPALAWGERGA